MRRAKKLMAIRSKWGEKESEKDSKVTRIAVNYFSFDWTSIVKWAGKSHPFLCNKAFRKTHFGLLQFSSFSAGRGAAAAAGDV